MARTPELQRFYASKRWRGLRDMLVVERHGRCDRCGKDCSDDTSQLIAHHKEHLTDDNLKDPNVAVNPDNIEILCAHCHAIQHRERGFISKRKEVFIIYGAPFAGKATYVRENMTDGDLVVDLDALYSAISYTPLYHHPDPLQRTAFGVRDYLYDQVRIRSGSWVTAWVIAGLPRRDERTRLAARLGGSLILVEATQEECLRRCVNAVADDPTDQEGYIRKWFAEYTP